MDEIYEMLPSGIFNDINGFNDYVSENGIESIYEMLPEGIFNSQEGFNNYVQKKKDESDSISPKEPPVSAAVRPFYAELLRPSQTPLFHGTDSAP